MKELKIGNVVILKSGGSQMTVSQILDNDKIECDWFDKEGKVQKHIFHKEMLEIDEQTDW